MRIREFMRMLRIINFYLRHSPANLRHSHFNLWRINLKPRLIN